MSKRPAQVVTPSDWSPPPASRVTTREMTPEEIARYGLSRPTRDELRTDLEAGFEAADIAAKYRTSQGRIAHMILRLKRAEMPMEKRVAYLRQMAQRPDPMVLSEERFQAPTPAPTKPQPVEAREALTPERLAEEIKELGTEAIGVKYGVSGPTVCRLLKEHGLENPRKKLKEKGEESVSPLAKPHDPSKEDMEAAIAQGMGSMKLMRRFGIGKLQLERLLKKYRLAIPRQWKRKAEVVETPEADESAEVPSEMPFAQRFIEAKIPLMSSLDKQLLATKPSETAEDDEDDEAGQTPRPETLQITVSNLCQYEAIRLIEQAVASVASTGRSVRLLIGREE